MPLNYPVDYTGVSPANKIDNELQLLSSANYGNYKVIIPDYSPFYAVGVHITKQSTGSVLVEGYDYVLTHSFNEASYSIGRAVYGSISITNPDISGTLVIDYQTVGGSWTLPANKIATILGNLFYNPRIAYWEQVAGYPAQFPPVNHDHSADDLVGMSDVVTAIMSIKAAVDTAYANYSASFATNQEALDGILSNKTMAPSTSKLVIDTAKAVLRGEYKTADVVINSNVSAVASDVLGDSTFINEGFNVGKDGANWNVRTGIGYINGRRVTQAQEFAVSVSSYPTDIYADAYDSNGTMVTGIVTKPGVSITNLLRYSEDFSNGYWVKSFSIGFQRNRYYNGEGLRNIDYLQFQGVADEDINQVLLPESITPGVSYIVSAWVKADATGPRTLKVRLGDSGPTVSVRLPTTAQRISFPVIAGEDKLLSISAPVATNVAFGEVQLQTTSTNYNMLVNGYELTAGTWTLVNATILDNNISGPYATSSPCAKLTGTAVTGVHGIRTGNMFLIGGQEYYFACYIKEDGSSTAPSLSITIAGLGGETETIIINIGPMTYTAAGGGLLMIRDPRVTLISTLQTVYFGYRKVEFTIVPNISTNFTMQFNLHNGTTTSFLGTVGNGIWLGGIALQARGSATNLLQHSEDFVDGIWDKPAAVIVPDLTGSLIVATALSEAGTAVADAHVVKQQVSNIRANLPYTFSVEFKAADYTCGFLRVRSGPNTASQNQDIELLFDINNVSSKRQTVTGGGWTGVNSAVTSLGGDWYRAILTGTSPSGTMSGEVHFGPAASTAVGGHLFMGDGVKGIRVRRTFFVVGDFISGYQLGDSYPITKYVSTAFIPRTDDNGGSFPPYVSDGVAHYPVKLATVTGSTTSIDRRNSIRRVKGILKNGVNKALPITSLTLMEANLRYFVANNATAVLPAAETLTPGDTFYLSKALGSVYYLKVENAVDDRIYFRDSYSNTILSEVEIFVNIDKDVTVLFDGTTFTLY